MPEAPSTVSDITRKNIVELPVSGGHRDAHVALDDDHKASLAPSDRKTAAPASVALSPMKMEFSSKRSPSAVSSVTSKHNARRLDNQEQPLHVHVDAVPVDTKPATFPNANSSHSFTSSAALRSTKVFPRAQKSSPAPKESAPTFSKHEEKSPSMQQPLSLLQPAPEATRKLMAPTSAALSNSAPEVGKEPKSPFLASPTPSKPTAHADKKVAPSLPSVVTKVSSAVRSFPTAVSNPRKNRFSSTKTASASKSRANSASSTTPYSAAHYGTKTASPAPVAATRLKAIQRPPSTTFAHSAFASNVRDKSAPSATTASARPFAPHKSATASSIVGEPTAVLRTPTLPGKHEVHASAHNPMTMSDATKHSSTMSRAIDKPNVSSVRKQTSYLGASSGGRKLPTSSPPEPAKTSGLAVGTGEPQVQLLAPVVSYKREAAHSYSGKSPVALHKHPTTSVAGTHIPTVSRIFHKPDEKPALKQTSHHRAYSGAPVRQSLPTWPPDSDSSKTPPSSAGKTSRSSSSSRFSSSDSTTLSSEPAASTVVIATTSVHKRAGSLPPWPPKSKNSDHSFKPPRQLTGLPPPPSRTTVYSKDETSGKSSQKSQVSPSSVPPSKGAHHDGSEKDYLQKPVYATNYQKEAHIKQSNATKDKGGVYAESGVVPYPSIGSGYRRPISMAPASSSSYFAKAKSKHDTDFKTGGSTHSRTPAMSSTLSSISSRGVEAKHDTVSEQNERSSSVEVAPASRPPAPLVATGAAGYVRSLPVPPAAHDGGAQRRQSRPAPAPPVATGVSEYSRPMPVPPAAHDGGAQRRQSRHPPAPPTAIGAGGYGRPLPVPPAGPVGGRYNRLR